MEPRNNPTERRIRRDTSKMLILALGTVLYATLAVTSPGNAQSCQRFDHRYIFIELFDDAHKEAKKKANEQALPHASLDKLIKITCYVDSLFTDRHDVGAQKIILYPIISSILHLLS